MSLGETVEAWKVIGGVGVLALLIFGLLALVVKALIAHQRQVFEFTIPRIVSDFKETTGKLVDNFREESALAREECRQERKELLEIAGLRKG